MKKIIAFIIALIIFIIFIQVHNIVLNNKIQDFEKDLYYMISDIKYNTMEAAKVCLNSRTTESILVLGSSELGTFNRDLFDNGNSNFNMYLVGRGHTQNFQSMLTLGAIENETHIKKAVLILSPQWFQQDGKLTSEMFASRFQKNIFNSFIENEKISYDTKKVIIERLKMLEVEDKLVLDKTNKYENAYLNYNIIDNIYLKIVDNISNTKQKMKLIEFLNEKDEQKYDYETIRFEDYNFESLLKEAEIEGETACSNNEFGIENNYYDTYIKEKIAELKDSKKDEKFLNEQEFEDLEMLLNVCKQMNIQLLIVSVPVNGSWYDYTGCTKEGREIYYSRIRSIAEKYNTKIADFSDCEYEKYFLKDIMHLGWKGWIKIDEAIYKFYKE